MEKKIIKTNEEEIKYVSPKTNVFEIKINSAFLQTSGSEEERDEII